jgi:hypothetical protein
MATAARDRLARTLRGDAGPAFSTELTARMEALTLDIEGFRAREVPGDAREGTQADRPRKARAVRPGQGDPDRP